MCQSIGRCSWHQAPTRKPPSTSWTTTLATRRWRKLAMPIFSGSRPPPDNVLLLPLELWHELVDPVAAVSPNTVRLQVHTTIHHTLPSDPSAAYVDATGLTRNFELSLAGDAVVGDNLAARLDAARSD